MRINSDFRDYYDCIQATGQDQTFVYQRFAREEILTHYPFHATSNYSYEQGGLNYHTVNIGFCGRVYPALKVNRHKWHIEGNKDNIKYCYSLNDIDNYVNEYCDKKEQEGYYYHYKNGHSVNLHGDLIEEFAPEELYNKIGSSYELAVKASERLH